MDQITIKKTARQLHAKLSKLGSEVPYMHLLEAVAQTSGVTCFNAAACAEPAKAAPAMSASDKALVLNRPTEDEVLFVELDNEDQALFVRDQLIHAREASCDGPSIHDLADDLAHALGWRMRVIRLQVPLREDWTFADLLPYAKLESARQDLEALGYRMDIDPGEILGEGHLLFRRASQGQPEQFIDVEERANLDPRVLELARKWSWTMDRLEASETASQAAEASSRSADALVPLDDVTYLTNALGEETWNGTLEVSDSDLQKIPFEEGPGFVLLYVVEIDRKAYVLGNLEVCHQHPDWDKEFNAKLQSVEDTEAWCLRAMDYIRPRLANVRGVLLELDDGMPDRFIIGVAIPLRSEMTREAIVASLEHAFGVLVDLPDEIPTV